MRRPYDHNLLFFRLFNNLFCNRSVLTDDHTACFHIYRTLLCILSVSHDHKVISAYKIRHEKSQAVDGVEEAEVMEIIDHNRLGSIQTMGPVFFRNQPVGCTATIVSQMYEENGVEIDPTNAALLCSAIISDTLMFRSPTCSPLDENTARKLAHKRDLSILFLMRRMQSRNIWNLYPDFYGRQHIFYLS